MIRIRKFIKKDRYGVVRGSIVLGLMLLLCVCMFALLVLNYSISVEGERAANAVHHVSAELDQMFASSLRQLEGAAARLVQEDAGETAALSLVDSADAFSGMSITVETTADTFAFTDGIIELNVSAADGSSLCAQMDMAYVEAALSDVFKEDYGYALYDTATGAFIINRTPFKNNGYYDALLHINDNAQAESLLNSVNAHARAKFDGSVSYIAQHQSALAPWSVSMVIPENLLKDDAIYVRYLPVLSVAVALVLIAMLALHTFLTSRRIRNANQNAVRALNASDRMMQIVSNEARETLIFYNCSQDCMLACYDGMDLLSRNSKPTAVRTILDIAELCGMNEAEAMRLYSRMHEMEPGSEANILARCSLESGDDCTLRFALFASSDRSRSVICCVSDCTRELESQDRAEVERSYQASMHQKATSIWQINISRNRWCMISSKNNDALCSLNMTVDEWRDYNAALSSQLREYLHPADYESFADAMSIVSIASMFRAGHSEFTQDYRVHGLKTGDYEWHRMRVRIWLHPETSDILANLYVFNVNAEKNAELERGERKRILNQALTAIGSIYYGLFYVDLENDLCYTAKALGGEMISQLSAPYKATFDRYIESYVHPEDKDGLRGILSAYYLRRNMTEGSHFHRREYRRRIGDDYGWAAIIVQPARFENGIIKEVVLAIRYIDRENETLEA